MHKLLWLLVLYAENGGRKAILLTDLYTSLDMCVLTVFVSLQSDTGFFFSLEMSTRLLLSTQSEW